MTEQEVFNAVYARLYDGKGQASNNSGHCLYETPDGNHCAVGIFLKDCSEAVRDFKGSIEGLLINFYDKLPSVVLQHERLLQMLQRVHDRHSNWDGNKFVGHEQLEAVAKRYNLEMPEGAQS